MTTDPAVSATSAVERAIAQTDRWDPYVHAVITRLDEVALEEARELDAGHRPGGRLAGMTVALKDNMDTAGIRTTMGSDFFREWIPDANAFVVDRLRAAGAIVTAKVNMAEFAIGATTQNPHWGLCGNVWDTARIPGGSSGGSAVAVAAGMARVALGTDTGGSVRLPASLNGILGLRPTLGRISNTGVMPVSASFDTVGPLAWSAEDLAQVFDAIDAYDETDPTSQDGPRRPVAPALRGSIAGMRVGVPEEYFLTTADQAISQAIEDVARVLADLGAHVVPTALAGADLAQQHMFRIIYPEAAALHADRLADEPGRFGEDVYRRLLLGVGVDARETARAIGWRRSWQRTVESALSDVDVILTPTTPVDVPLIEGAEMVRTTHQIGQFTYAFSMFTGPSLSMPCGRHPGSGMPIGAQLTAAPWREDVLLTVAAAYQTRTDWLSRRPSAPQ